MAHDVVQQRVDTRRQEVQDAGNVRQHRVAVEEELVVGVGYVPVHGHQPLGVKRCPAEEERRHDGH